MLKIRLRRIGAIRQPHYRIVVADARSPRDGAFIEILGHYNPRTQPATIQVDVAKYDEWKRKGAQPTNAVERLVKEFNRGAAATAQVEAPAADRRTRTASGKRVTVAPPPAPAPVPAELPGEDETDEPVLEAAAETPEGAVEGETDTDTAS